MPTTAGMLLHLLLLSAAAAAAPAAAPGCPADASAAPWGPRDHARASKSARDMSPSLSATASAEIRRILSDRLLATHGAAAFQPCAAFSLAELHELEHTLLCARDSESAGGYLDLRAPRSALGARLIVARLRG